VGVGGGVYMCVGGLCACVWVCACVIVRVCMHVCMRACVRAFYYCVS
jgi:hypothetical protein